MSAPVTWASVQFPSNNPLISKIPNTIYRSNFIEKIKQSDSQQPISNDNVSCYLAVRVTVVLIGAHWTILPKLSFSGTNWQTLPAASLSRHESLQNDPSGLVQDLCGCITRQFMCCAFVRDGLCGWEQGLPLHSAAHSLLYHGQHQHRGTAAKPCAWWDVKLKRTGTHKAFTLSSSGPTEIKTQTPNESAKRSEQNRTSEHMKATDSKKCNHFRQ